MDPFWQNNVSVFNMLPMLVIALFPRSKCLLILWLQSPSAVNLEPPKIKSVTVSIVSPSICHVVMGPDAMKLFWMLSFKPTKVHLVKAMVFPVVMCRCESWTIKKAECWRIDAFELWYWRRLLRVPWTARRSNQSILKEISPGFSLEELMLKLKLQYLATSCEELIHWKRLWCWEGLGAGGEGH